MAYPPPPFRFDTTASVLELPSLRYSAKRRLPDAPGVYFVLTDDDEVLYIGCAYDSIKRRWLAHEQTKQARRECDIRIAYVVCPDNPLRHVAEEFAIYMLQPRLNVMHKGRRKPYFDKE